MDLNELGKNPEQIKQLIALLQNLLPSENVDNGTVEDMGPENSSHIRSKTIGKNDKRPASENKFLRMPEMNMHKEDAVLDKQLCKHPPVARAREYEPVNVRCRVCGKIEIVNPSLIESVVRYKCNKCATSAG